MTATGQNGFNDIITFDAPVLPTGATATFTPPTVIGSGVTTTTVTIHAPSPGGTFTFTLRGTASSGLTHGAAGSLAVQDYRVTSLSPTPSAGAGDTVQYQFAIGALGGFNGIVAISPASIVVRADNNTPNRNCSPGGAGPSQQYASGVLTLTIPINSSRCDAWTYHLDLTFFSGSIFHNVTVGLNAVTTGVFNLTSPLAPLSFAGGATAALPIHVSTRLASQSVFFPTNLIAIPCGSVSSFPASVTATAATAADTALTLNTAGCAAGSYTAIVNGQGQFVTQGLAIPFVIGTAAPPDFSIQGTPSARTVAPGSGDLYTLNVAPRNGFSQPVSFAVSGALPPGVTASFPSGNAVSGIGAVSLRLDASATAASGTITITGTGGGLVRSTTLTLNVVAPPPQTGFTLGTLPATTVPGDGTVVSVAIPVTMLNNSTANVTLRSTSHLPPGMNATISGHRLMLSAASGVAPGTYSVEFEGNDGNGNICHGGGPVGVGGSGGAVLVPAPVITSVTGLGGSSNPAAVIAGVSTNVTIQGRNFGTTPPRIEYYLDGWTPLNPGAPFWPANATTGSYRINSWTDASINADITLPPEATGLWRVETFRDGWISDFDATHPSTGLLQVYDATPKVDTVTLTDAATGTYTIAGNSFGTAPGSVRVCAFPAGSGPCTQSPDWTVGGINLWGAVIRVALNPSITASGHYCVQVTRLGANGAAFAPAPFSGSGATSDCAGDVQPPPPAPNGQITRTVGTASTTVSGRAANSPNVVSVGEQVHLTGAVLNLGGLTIVKQLWTVQGSTVKSYVQTLDLVATPNASSGIKTNLQPADVANSDITFYWIDGDNGLNDTTYNVTYAATLSDQSTVTVVAGFRPVRPSPVTFNSATTTATPAINVNSGQFVDQNGNPIPSLNFGTNLSKGITFNSTVSTGYGGKFALLQLVNRANTYTFADSTHQTLDSGGLCWMPGRAPMACPSTIAQPTARSRRYLRDRPIYLVSSTCRRLASREPISRRLPQRCISRRI